MADCHQIWYKVCLIVKVMGCQRYAMHLFSVQLSPFFKIPPKIRRPLVLRPLKNSLKRLSIFMRGYFTHVMTKKKVFKAGLKRENFKTVGLKKEGLLVLPYIYSIYIHKIKKYTLSSRVYC